MVREFHEAFQPPLRDAPKASVPAELVETRRCLLKEEVGELDDACAEGNLIGIADSLADVVYVAYGTALTFGIDLDRVLAEVHRSNMSKLGPDGQPLIAPSGKVIKGPLYQPPRIACTLWPTDEWHRD